MLSIPGLGPKKIKALNDKLGVETVEQLEKACQDGKVAELDGFGEKTQAKILQGIQFRRQYASRHLLGDALAVAEPILESLRSHPDVVRCSTAGSLRRSKEIIGDIDLLASSRNPAAVIDFFTSKPGIISVTAKGETKASVVLAGGIQADLRVVSDAEFPFALAYFTGSKEHNIVMRQRAIQRGLRLNEYGLFKSDVETRDPKLAGALPHRGGDFSETWPGLRPAGIARGRRRIRRRGKTRTAAPARMDATQRLAAQSFQLERRPRHAGGNRRLHAGTGLRILGHHRPLQILLPGQRPPARRACASKSGKSAP